jgi:hypothetical protein
MVSLACLLCSLFWAWPAAADDDSVDPADDFSGRPRLRELIWRLAGWLPPGDPLWAGEIKRSVVTPLGPDGGPGLRASMTFDDTLSAWPSAVKIDCPTESGTTRVVSDSRPFGGPNLSGGGAECLEGCLELADRLLGGRLRIEPPKWREIEPGLKLARTTARYGCRLGGDEVLLIKASPELFRLAPYHEAERPEWAASPTDVGGWFERLGGPPVVLNGVQYLPDRSAMSLLRRDGVRLPSSLHANWKGFLVQGPLKPEAPRSALIDAELTGSDGPSMDDYGTVIQSYMIVDAQGGVRVRNSELLASRAALGVDPSGDFLAIMVPGGATLADLAALLKDLGVVGVLGLDGGLETQWAIKGRRGAGAKIYSGKFARNVLGNFRIEGYLPTLPTVVAFERRSEPNGSESGDSSPVR